MSQQSQALQTLQRQQIQIQRAKKLTKLCTCPYPQSSSYYWTWIPRKICFNTKMAVIRAIYYCTTDPFKNEVPYTWILNKMFLAGMKDEFVETVRKKRIGVKGAKFVLLKRIKRDKMKTMIKSVRKWDWKVVSLNYVMNPSAFQAGGGRNDELPIEVQMQAHKILDHISKRVNDKYIYFETIEELLRTITESYGNIKTFLSKQEMERFEKAQENKRAMDFANDDTSQSDVDEDDDIPSDDTDDGDTSNNEDHSEEEKHEEDTCDQEPPNVHDNTSEIDEDLLHVLLTNDKGIGAMILSQNGANDMGVNHVEDNDIDQGIAANECDFDVDTETQAILVDRNKIGRFKYKWNIVRSGSKYSTHFQLNDVLARSMESLAKCMAIRKILPIQYLLDRDQSMQFSHLDRKKKFTTKNTQNAAGQKKISNDRQTYTKSPLIIVETEALERGELKGDLGETLVIIPVTTKSGQPSANLCKKLDTIGLKFGRNDNIGRNGMYLAHSGNGWQQEINLSADVDGVNKVQHGILGTDGWTLFKYSSYIDPILDNCNYPLIRPPGLSGCIGPLDAARQHMDKVLLGKKQIQHREDPNVPRNEKYTSGDKLKAAPIHIQMKFMAEIENEQSKDIRKWSTPETFVKTGWGLNPYEHTELDELFMKQVLSKQHSKGTDGLYALNRLHFNPLSMNPEELMEYVKRNRIHDKRKGYKVHDNGKTSTLYTKKEVYAWEGALAAGCGIFEDVHDDLRRFHEDLITMSDEMKSKCDEYNGWQDIPRSERSSKEFYHATYEYFNGEYNWWSHFHAYTEANYPSCAYPAPPSDAHLEPDDSDNDDDMKKWRKTKRECQKVMEKCARKRYKKCTKKAEQRSDKTMMAMRGIKKRRSDILGTPLFERCDTLNMSSSSEERHDYEGDCDDDEYECDNNEYRPRYNNGYADEESISEDDNHNGH